MTAINSALKTVRVGKEATLDATPSTFTYIKPQGDPLFPDVMVEKIEQTGQRDAGQIAAACVGNSTGAASIDLLARGSGTAADDGDTAGTAELGVLMAAALGNDAVSDTSDSITSATGSTITVGSGGGSHYTVGNAVLFKSSISSGYIYEIGFIKSIAGDVITLEHAPRGTVVTASAVLYSSSTWTANQTDGAGHDTVQLQVFADDDWSKYLKGCSVIGSLDIPESGQSHIKFDLVADDVERDDSGVTSPTFVSATSACAITMANNNFHFGGDRKELISANVDFGFDVAQIPAQSGANGHSGHMYTWRGAKVTGKMFYDATVYGDMDSASTFDLELQVGISGGNALAVMMRDVSFTSAKHATSSGIDVLEFEGHTTGADSFSIAVFGQ